MIVKSTWWVAAVQPVILSLGAVLAAIDLDALDVQPIEWRNLLKIFKSAKVEDEDEEE